MECVQAEQLGDGPQDNADPPQQHEGADDDTKDQTEDPPRAVAALTRAKELLHRMISPDREERAVERHHLSWMPEKHGANDPNAEADWQAHEGNETGRSHRGGGGTHVWIMWA